MKTHILYLFLTLLTFSSFGQVTFEKGYFINNENQRIECLIKNYDQKNSPKGIEYKIDENSETQNGMITSIKEFGIINDSKFIRVETNIDRSSNDLAKPSENSIPFWSHEQLFLKVLVEGKASLFSYDDITTSRFFYSVGDSTVKQLIYKEYLSEDRKYLLTNNGFRQQLWTEIRCENASENSVENIRYTEIALKKYFNRYNDCNGSASKEYKIKEKKNAFHLKMTSGFTQTSATFSVTGQAYKDTEFEKAIDFRFGIEGEYTLPVNKGKWRIVIEPSYQHYSSESESFLGSTTIQYRSLEFPLGLRYYAILNDNLNIFANALYVVNSGLNFNSAITIEYPYSQPIIIETVSCLAFGLGVNYKRLSSEIRINSNRNIVSRYNYYTDYLVSSFIIGFKIF